MRTERTYGIFYSVMKISISLLYIALLHYVIRVQSHLLQCRRNFFTRAIRCRMALQCVEKSNSGEPKSLKDLTTDAWKQRKRLSVQFLALYCSKVIKPVRADTSLTDKGNKIATFNIPSDDFWYPPYMIGRWNTSLIFNGATFSNRIPLEELVEKDAAPGFRDMSIIFAPQVGKDVHNVTLRYVQIDSHTREDHPFNIRQLVQAFSPDIEVTAAPYSFQKAPDWFHSEANRWQIDYRNKSSGIKGAVQLYTKKRNINVFAGNVETTEYFTQVRSGWLSSCPITQILLIFF